ncbi:hypothetical protein BLNAU_514 [Blattamonas nauphoetae]|uniref:Uncharacterized protein n=1 Tax=Blattamonas nauphoetae TaxID=2049346 RepID=A0ABQ9YLH3_9EUKA|nr:hypothetical protein BLNAU_514 [Blattamonas nauphoetae]
MDNDLTYEEIEKCGELFRLCQTTDEPTISVWNAHKPLQTLGYFPSSRLLTSNDIFILSSTIDGVMTSKITFPQFLQLVYKAKLLSKKPAEDPFPEDAFRALAQNPSVGGKVPLDQLRQILADFSFSVDIDTYFNEHYPQEWCISLEEFEAFLRATAKPMANLDCS